MLQRISIYVFVLCVGVGVAHSQNRPSHVQEAIQGLYGNASSLKMIAVSEDSRRQIHVSVSDDGRYSFVQYDKEVYLRTYGENRDVENEWAIRPAHFDYYDGATQLLAAAPHDFARLYVEHNLEHPMAIAESLQSKHCIWPLLPALAQKGQVDSSANGVHIIRVSSLDLRVYLNSSFQVEKVTWGEEGYPEVPNAVFEYAGYAQGDIYPTEMVRSMGFGQAGTAERSATHEHYDLVFESDTDIVESSLVFIDDSNLYNRKNASTDDVYDANGEFLYNEQEMAEEYLAAIKDSGPNQWRVALLVGIGVIAFGSAVVLKVKRAS